MDGLNFDIAHLFAGGLVLVSFMMIYQDRLYALLNVFALHAFVLAFSVGWQAHVQDAPHLYITTAIAIVFKGIIIPVALHRIIQRLGIHREIETVVGISPTMLFRIGLVGPSLAAMPTVILLIPLGAAALLALLPGYRLTARLNVLATFLTLAAALSLFFFQRPEAGPYLLIDDLNVVFIALNTFVGFTTSVFSASYIAHELHIGRLTPTYLRFYHPMYHVLMFAMNLALSANNIGLM